MSYLEDMGKAVGSRRYARDLASDAHVTTKPWWNAPGEESRVDFADNWFSDQLPDFNQIATLTITPISK